MAHARINAVAGAKWDDFAVRAGSVAILAPLALLALWLGGAAWVLLILVALAGLGDEWARLAGLRRFTPGWAVLAVGLAAAPILGISLGWVVGVLALALLAAFELRSGWFAACGVPYAGIAGLSLIWLRWQPQGLMITAFLVVVIWATDIGAYVVGRVLGGVRLAPRISPGKTVSGSLGGLLFGGAAGVLLAGTWRVLPAALLLSLCAQGGDLLESAVKRKLGVKDSGRTIPGHGGLFDRLDGFLVATPVAVLLVLGVAGIMPV